MKKTKFLWPCLIISGTTIPICLSSYLLIKTRKDNMSYDDSDTYPGKDHQFLDNAGVIEFMQKKLNEKYELFNKLNSFRSNEFSFRSFDSNPKIESIKNEISKLEMEIKEIYEKLKNDIQETELIRLQSNKNKKLN